MKRKLLVTLIALVFGSYIFGQQPISTVYLKNGSIIKGTITETNPDHITVEIGSTNRLTFSGTEVEKIEVVGSPTLQNHHIGYTFTFSGGSLIGSSKNESQTPLSLLMEHQLRYKQVSFGGVLGIEFLNEAVMPLGLTLKWIYPAANRTELFIGGSGGILHSLEEPSDPYDQIKEHNGGTFANAEAGIIFTSVSRTRLFVAAGYRYSELHYVYNNWWYTEVDQDMYFNRFSIRFGLWFE